jgi:hypothetical protein
MLRLSRALVVLLVAGAAVAGELSGSATTVIRAFDVLHVEIAQQQGGAVPRVLELRPVDQYLSLAWDELGRARAWTIDASLRWRMDLAGDPHFDPQFPTSDLSNEWQDDDLDLRTLRARWTSSHGLIGLSLGRQPTLVGLGWSAFDGARLDFPRAPHVKAFVQAGLPLETWDYGSPDDKGFTWGAGVTGVFPHHGSLGVDYELVRSHGIELEENAGLDLGLRFASTRVAATVDYSLLQDIFGETSVELEHAFHRRHVLTASFARVVPIFRSDEIWSVFEVNGYDEQRLAYEWRGAGRLQIGGTLVREDYDHAELGGLRTISRAAATLRYEGRHEAVHRSEIGWQHGWSGDRIALKHDSDWAVTRRLRAGAGASIHRYDNRYRLVEEDEVIAVRGRLEVVGEARWTLGLEVEQYFGRDRDATRASLSFTTRFGRRRDELPWWGGRFTRSTPGSAHEASPASKPASEAPQ